MGYCGRPRRRARRRRLGHRHAGQGADLRQARVRQPALRRPRRPAAAVIDGVPAAAAINGADAWIRKASPATIAAAAGLLRAGRLVVFPTETVYGLGADATSEEAVAQIFAAKRRPQFNPLIVHVTGLDAAERIAVFDPRARRLAERLWPGPLTLVLPRRSDCGLSLLVSAGLDTVAVRAPDNATARSLLDACERPIAAPSANISGGISPTMAADVEPELRNAVGCVLDGGACRIGIESTILDLSGATPVLLRPGGIAREEVQALAGPIALAGSDAPVRAPGMLRRHYAPHRPLRLDASDARPGEALLGFGPGFRDAALNLSPSGDVVEAASNLFAMLRALDRAPGFAAIAVAPVPAQGLGIAIADRLRRAAAPADVLDEGNDDRGPAAPCILPDQAFDA
ncbi:MAG: threonylcarbamoyl-AMP synthase [Rhodospirillales bacterium]|nr:threonylcarbamoyl-AMP synthase [Rhodospirillales bacterium]